MTITLVDYCIVNHSFIYLIGVSDLCAVTETAIVLYYLYALLLSSALSYGFYHLTAMILSPDVPDVPAKSRMGTIENIVMTAVTAGTFSMMSLGAAFGAFANTYHMGRRYLASPLGQFIVALPGVRLIPHVHRKYWLPSAVSFRPRPRFFYLTRLTIRQSNVSYHFLNFYFLNYFLYRC